VNQWEDQSQRTRGIKKEERKNELNKKGKKKRTLLIIPEVFL